VKKNLFRFCLDLLMLLILSLLYSANKLPIGLHQIAAMLLLALFVSHFLLGRRALAGFGTSRRMRLFLLIDGFLALSFLTLFASGLSIHVHPFSSWAGDNPWGLVVHQRAGAAALILAGVHLGLHWKFFRNIAVKYNPLPRIVAIPLLLLLFAFFYILGIYNIAGGSLLRLLLSSSFSGGEGIAILNPLSILVVIASLTAFASRQKEKGKRKKKK
jgi:hypothetical protein